MKNLFKNLMLVAVAAMAFTACQNDSNEVNEVNRVTRYEFTANIADDTRSGFAEKEEGATAYKSEWFGDETLKLFLSTNEGWSDETTASIDTEGMFSFELENAPESFFMIVCSPAESWSSQYSSTIPAEQTPLANSVDPKAHLLLSNSIYVTNGAADEINLIHQAAYGKMTVNAPEGFVIAKVDIELNGTFYGYAANATYTLNANNVENNTFWFASIPTEVSNFTVTAYDAEGNAVAKTVSMEGKEKPLAFSYGRVSTFSVSNLEAIEVEPEAPKTLVFTSASWANSNASDKLVKFYTEDGAILQLNWYNCGSDNWIVPNTYGFANSGAIYPGGQYSWYENSAFGIDTEIVGGTVIVSVVDGQYYIEFKNLVDYSAVQIESATFTGQISGLQVPDMRTKLAAPTNITSSVDGKTITLSWDAVEGADGYRVKLFSPYDESKEEIVTTTEYVCETQLYSTEYSFTIMSYANDENTQYRSSDDAYAYVTTGKDPNGPIADYMWDETFVWNNSGYFELRDSSYSTSYWYIYLNAADRPGNNSIKPGVYTGTNTTSPGEGEFSVKISASGSAPFWGIYASYLSNAHTLEVKVVDGKYQIAFTYSNASHGYIGLPDGFVLPGEGGDSGEGGDEPVDPDQPEQPDPDQPDPDQPGDSLEGYNTVSFVSLSKGSYMGYTYNWIGNFVFDYMGSAITFTMCDYKGPMQAASKNIKEGVYTNNGNGANAETKELYNISIAGMTGNTGSTVEVSKDGSDYVFKMTMKTVNGEYKFYYKGAL